MKNGVISDDVIVSDLAEITDGYSGADIDAICNEARDTALSEALKNSAIRKITSEDFVLRNLYSSRKLMI